MQVTLEAIKFNHDPASATGDAFNIRRNETEVVDIPEWRSGSANPEDSPAAYARDALQNRAPIIRAKFDFQDFDASIKSVRIQALDGRVRQALSANVLGIVVDREVLLTGGEEFELFNLDKVQIATAGVSVSDIIWDWQFSLDGANWKPITTSTHRIYTVLSLPGEPWHPNSDSSDTQLPWTSVLEPACDWASGTTNFDSVAFAITKTINSLGPAFIKYDFVNNGHSALVEEDPPRFDCQRFLNLLNSDPVVVELLVNCDDSAAMVCTFANVLGCSLPQAVIASPDAAEFSLRRHEKLGLRRKDFDQFKHHVIGWAGGDQDPVSDACLKLDGSGQDTGRFEPIIASGLSFASKGGYRDRLVIAGEKCTFRHKFSRRVGLTTPKPSPLTGEKLQPSLVVDALNQLSAFGDWAQVDLRYVPEGKVQTYWALATDPNGPILRLDVQVSLTEKEADANLMAELDRFNIPGMELKPDAGFGQKVFANQTGFTILFSRNRMVSLLRNVGRTPTPLWEAARIIDKFLQRLNNN